MVLLVAEAGNEVGLSDGEAEVVTKTEVEDVMPEAELVAELRLAGDEDELLDKELALRVLLTLLDGVCSTELVTDDVSDVDALVVGDVVGVPVGEALGVGVGVEDGNGVGTATRRIRKLPESAMYTTTRPLLGFRIVDTANGLFILAAVGLPPSPL